MRKPKSVKTGAGKASIRCAIYTRKSHEEGLEQDFNSLDAQREACEAYIVSQKHEGWTCLTEMYDDGGVSGATMQRPALARLLEDIEAHRIDAVVVYKVDRLTRSLGDFAKIVEVFDRHNVSFVSVTQAFNTTNSMGRLTLNMLLSFAQFEREVTGERIRDKIAASKKKGMWMGGLVPLGYDARDRKLEINPVEAKAVRHIFRRYVALGSVAALKDELDSDGIVSKIRIDRFGRKTGGKPLARGALYLMLQNPIYRGEIVHKDKSYPGEHEAIIDPTLWDEVQNTLTSNRNNRCGASGPKEKSLLAGLIYDDRGERLLPSHANKKGTRYRYYVSQDLVKKRRRQALQGRRVPAGELELLVENRLRRFLSSAAEVFGAIEHHAPDANDRADLVARAANLAERWPGLSQTENRNNLISLIERIDLMRKSLEIHIRPGKLAAILIGESDNQFPENSIEDKGPTITLTETTCLKRTGMETRLLIDGKDSRARTKVDHSLRRVLAHAQKYRALLMRGSGKTMAELAAEAGVGGSYFSRVLRLSFLSPEVTKAILQNRHPVTLTAKKLANETRLPIAWQEQRALLQVD